MSEIQLFSIASQHAKWLGERQTVIASNVANASTPGYKANDILPFSSVMDVTKTGLTVTNAKHFGINGDVGQSGATPVRPDPSGKTSHSGNSVSVEREMVKASEVAGAYSLNTNIIKSFHRMILMSVRSR